MTLVFALLFVVAAVAAFAFRTQLVALQKVQAARRPVAAEAAGSSGDDKARKELTTLRDELARRKAEATELREKLNDLRSKNHKQKAIDSRTKSAAVIELQDALDQARDRANAEQARADVLARDAAGMHEEIVRLKASLTRTDDALKAALSRPAPAEGAVVVPVAVSTKTDEQLQARVASLESQLREARRKVADGEEELRKAKGTAASSKRQFVVTRSELDLFREKLVWSEKRVVEVEKLLFDHKIELPTREAAPQPKAPTLAPGMTAREGANTGGEGVVAAGAEYVPEEATVAVEAAAVVEAAAAEAAPVIEAAQVVEVVALTEASGPQAVPPIRRPKAESEAQAE
jgi:predicted  nucleic acid-binding Zn-ribbon protein